MGISKSGRMTRKRTGGRKKQARKKRAYEKARPTSATKLGDRKVRLVRVRGGGYKFRALRLSHGNFAWRSEHCTRKTRVTDVVYSASNDEWVRTKTIAKNSIVLIDASPFKQWYRNHYNVELSDGTYKRLNTDKLSKDQASQFARRQKKNPLPENLVSQFKNGKVYACITSKPGQVGRCDGYILEGDELDFYAKKIAARHKK